ncbi:MAG: adenylyltransferase/cytidyltransferase family protein [Candidatus Liptonbacteria bacterium]|nr:adenylyltransferase/cytidyltransferase family protein [Candidatus Liptonbacteria bacterium]
MKNKKGKTKKIKVVAVSGGFDPVHIGHIRLFEEAKKLGDKLMVILNNDNWLKKKKGYVFMPERERKEVIEALRPVDMVFLTSHKKNPQDMSINAELKKLKPHIFANGGDRMQSNIPEVAVCDLIGCEMIFGVGKGGKIQSSSWLLKPHLKHFSIRDMSQFLQDKGTTTPGLRSRNGSFGGVSKVRRTRL